MTTKKLNLKFYRLYFIFRWCDMNFKYISIGQRLSSATEANSTSLRVITASNNLHEPWNLLWNIIVEHLNLRITTIKYNKANDILSNLLNNGTDIVLGGFMTSVHPMVQVSMPLYESVYRVYVQPIHVPVPATDLLKTFSLNMWITCCIFFFLFPILIWIKTQFIFQSKGSYFHSTEKDVTIKHKNRELGNYIINSFGSISEQGLNLYATFWKNGWDLIPDDIPNAILAFTTQMLGSIISKTFSAIMISYLMAPDLTLPFRDLNDLQHSSYQLCWRSAEYFDDHFEVSKINEKMNLINSGCPELRSEHDFEYYWCNDKIAFLESSRFMTRTGYKYSRRCNMAVLATAVQINNVVFLERFNMYLSSEIKSTIIRLYTSGLKDYFAYKPILNNPFKILKLRSIVFNEVSLAHIWVLLMFYMYATGLCLFLLLLENLTKYGILSSVFIKS